MRPFRFNVHAGSTVRLFGPDDTLIDERPLAVNEIDCIVKAVGHGYRAEAPDLVGLGRRLYAWLDGPSHRWLAKARDGNAGLTLHIDVQGRLRHLPWELLADDGLFLCAMPNYPCTPVRRVHDHRHDDRKEQNRPLRILFMACSAEDIASVLDFEIEERLILDAVQGQSIELVIEESGSLDGLKERIESFDPGYFDVFHLTGHAEIKDGKPCFVMEDEVGRARRAFAKEIVAAFQDRSPPLVFLSGCRTGQAVQDGTLPSLCEAVVTAGTPAVLGWGMPVSDLWASIAAHELYHHLAVGKPIDESVARASARLFAEKSPNWHHLRLYADATPLARLVTPLNTIDRAKIRLRAAHTEYIDAGAKGEVCPREQFVGRRRAIQRCLRILRAPQGEDGYHEGVLLHGMGGLGKSSLAARLCERLPSYKRLVWVGALDEQQFLLGIPDKLDDANVGVILNEPKLPFKARLCKLLSQCFAELPVLFVLDDFEQNVETVADGAPKLDDQGRAILKPPANDFLKAIVEAIRETASDSRIIITCRYQFVPPSPTALLYEEPLEHLRGAELAKKLAQLSRLSPEADTEASIKQRAIRLGAGNPRLLTRLNHVLGETAHDFTAILECLENTVEEFREGVLLYQLFTRQSPECRRILARLAVCELAVDQEAVEAIADETRVAAHLKHAAALGLVEAGIDPLRRNDVYFVSGVLASPLIAELAHEEQGNACARAAQVLFQKWWVSERGKRLEEALEVHRLAISGGQKEIAVEIADYLALSWVKRARYRSAEALCRLTLQLGEDYRILHTIARAEQILGRTEVARRHYERALALSPAIDSRTPLEVVQIRAGILSDLGCMYVHQGDVALGLELQRQSLVLAQQSGDIRGQSATLSNMAQLFADRGDIQKAMELWEESLELKDQIGDDRGKGIALSKMARIIAQRGDVKRAVGLWEQSLKLSERAGDVQGRVGTLRELAWLSSQNGNDKRAMELWDKSLKLLDQIGDVQGKAATMHDVARVVARLGNTRRALELWEQCISLQDQIGDIHGKANTLHSMGGTIAKQGDESRASSLWDQALKLYEQIGNVHGKANTLSSIAQVAFRQGNRDRAMGLRGQSVKLYEQIGDMHGKAATLAWMAWVVRQMGDHGRARELNIQSARQFAFVQAWLDLIRVLSNLGSNRSRVKTPKN